MIRIIPIMSQATDPSRGPCQIIDAPELGIASQFLDEIRAVISNPKYDHLKLTELLGALDLIKFEHSLEWIQP